jgi:NAD(P)H-dependent flavin oxidoreductase YrpB (nitropropane dioxygenase family)
MLAGMDQVAGPELAAAVTNAGGFGTLGGARYTPKMLREMIAEMKGLLKDKDAPFGVDLLLPQVGEGARKTTVSCLQKGWELRWSEVVFILDALKPISTEQK